MHPSGGSYFPRMVDPLRVAPLQATQLVHPGKPVQNGQVDDFLKCPVECTDLPVRPAAVVVAMDLAADVDGPDDINSRLVLQIYDAWCWTFISTVVRGHSLDPVVARR